ncbi:MAG: DUF2298 domain-containing protein [Acidobacteriota bacterium]|nr:DUF2298 domain-containing protein [Acidobacteriota bacterium]
MTATEAEIPAPAGREGRRARAIFLAILVAGAILRFVGLAWDDAHHLHPDERHISMVEENLEAPKSIRNYFDSATSPLNPYNRKHDSFVYGTLPLFLTRAVAHAVHRPGYDGAYLVGRALSALFDLVTVWLTYLIARRFGGRRPALAASALIAFCPLAIQLAHYWTVDSFLTTFVAATLLGSVRIAQGKSSWGGVAATGAALGLAVACKITALALFGAVGLALLVEAAQAGRDASRAAARVVLRSLLAAAAAYAAIRVGLPYVFAGWRLDPRYVRDMQALMSLSKSVAGFPPALQWAGRTVLFPLRNFVFWGAGPFFGIAALAAFAAALLTSWRRERRPLLPLLLYAAIVCAYHGLTLSKSIRYFYPAYPVFAVVTALFLARLAGRPAASRIARALPAIVVLGTVLAGIAFSSIYRRPHTRVAASRWIYEHVPPPARFSSESWDDALPLPLPGYEANRYEGPAMDLWGPDNAAKVEAVVGTLAKTDWLAITSNRVYGNITRLPSVFPMTTAYYRALFEGRLGFERDADFTSYPSLGPLRFPDDRAEEQFTVYDHPRVLLFRKTPAFSESRARAILLAAIPVTPPTIWEWEKAPRRSRRVSESILPPRQAGAERASAASERSGGSWSAAVLFYLATALVGLLALPFVTVLFGSLPDKGAGMARIVGLAVATYALTVLVQARVLGNGRGAAVAGLAVLALLSVAALAARGRVISAFWRTHGRSLAETEAAFAIGFALFAGLRAMNPEIFWGEKPMDFSILNILVRTPVLPASDPWFAGAPLGYYTFGHEMVALLTMLTGLSTRFTFNLAFGLLGGAAMSGAYSLARNWTGARRTGVVAAGFVAILGNLAGLREWLVNQPARHEARHLDWHYFWATSRVIRDTINEYPFWSLTFADLHAHVFAIPLFLVVAACALALLRRAAVPGARLPPILVSAAALGGAVASQALTNAWDVPLLGGLLVLIAAAAAFSSGRLSAAGTLRAILVFLVSAGTALLLVLPLWVRGGGAPGHGRNDGPGARGIDILTVFGVFIFLAIAWWLITALRRRDPERRGRRALGAVALLAGALLAALAVRLPDAFCATAIFLFLFAAIFFVRLPEDRLACGFVATAFFLILVAQRFYIYDRMNTYFKLYLEAWLLFAVGCAVLVFGQAGRPGAFSSWPRPIRAIAVLLFAAGIFTSASGAYGVLAPNRSSLPDGVRASSPTLDGLAYRERWHPGEYRAVEWLRRSIRGTPVVLEAQGPSYQEFGRISMLTGLPTVLGWDYHVQQRGNPPARIEERRAAVAEIYSSPKASAAEALLRRYHVGYVYVGSLERKTYPAAGLAKFRMAKDLFQVAYENPEATVYRVAGGDSQDVVAPERETLPVPAPEAAASAAAPDTEPEEAPEIAESAAEGSPPWERLKEPRGAAVDSRERIWIADFGHSRLRVFDAKGGFLGGWGGRGAGQHGFRELCAVAARGDDLYVADTWNGRIVRFDLAGRWKAAAAELYGPRGVAVAPDGRVWATDTGNHRVMVYEADLTGGRVIGQKGSGPGQFSGPIGIAIAPSGLVYVADTANKRIQTIGADEKVAGGWPVAGWGDSAEPHLAVSDDGSVYASDPTGNAVLEFAPDGKLLRKLLADPSGKAFSRPTGLAISGKARILYVVNSGNSSVAACPLPERKSR